VTLKKVMSGRAPAKDVDVEDIGGAARVLGGKLTQINLYRYTGQNGPIGVSPRSLSDYEKQDFWHYTIEFEGVQFNMAEQHQ
jgi:hypothetical protein